MIGSGMTKDKLIVPRPKASLLVFPDDLPPVGFLEIPTSLPDQITDPDIPSTALPFIHGNGLQIQVFLAHVDIAAFFDVFHAFTPGSAPLNYTQRAPHTQHAQDYPQIIRAQA
jgi:hypothetical protein